LYRSLSGTIFRRFSIALFMWAIILVLFFFVARFLLTRQIWYGTETLYPVLHSISQHPLFFGMIVWLVGLVGVFFYFWRRTLSYIDAVAMAGSLLLAEETERIELPKELIQLEEQLNRAKRQNVRNMELAREAEQRKNDLIVYLAHDLKTPLTSVIGYLTLLVDEPQISPQLQQRYLSIAADKAQRLEDLINEFFEITRFNLTQLVLEKSYVNISRMLEQIVSEFEPLFLEKRLTCEPHIEQGLGLVCDVDKLERVFDNLLRNAVNYCYPEGCICVDARKRENWLVFCFSNPGKTIPAEKLSHIFEQFFRLDSSRSSGTGGAGLGLAIAKEIVEAHGGTITAFSENERVEFVVELPEQNFDDNSAGGVEG